MGTQKIKFVKTGLVFLVILIILVLGLNTLYVQTIQNKKIVFRQVEQFDNFVKDLNLKKIDLIFFGDSHTGHAMNPRYFANSFNFATGLEDYVETYFKFKNIIETQNITVGTIALELDLHMFSKKLRTDDNLFKNLNLYYSWVSLDFISQSTGKSKLSLFINSNFPVVGKGQEFSRLFFSSKFTELYLGWTNNSNGINSTEAIGNAKTRVNIHFDKNYSGDIDIRSFTYFLKLIKLAKLNDVRVVFIQYPLSNEYATEFNKLNVSSKVYYDSIFNEVDNIIFNDYSLFNYYDLFFENSEYFGDADHVNAKGSKVLSDKFGKDLSLSLFKSWNNSSEFITEQSSRLIIVNTTKTVVG